MKEIKAAGNGAIPHGDRLAVAVDLDEFQQAVSKVKAGAAAVTALYSGEIRDVYTDDLLELVSTQLHEAARYFDGVASGEQ